MFKSTNLETRVTAIIAALTLAALIASLVL